MSFLDVCVYGNKKVYFGMYVIFLGGGLIVVDSIFVMYFGWWWNWCVLILDYDKDDCFGEFLVLGFVSWVMISISISCMEVVYCGFV